MKAPMSSAYTGRRAEQVMSGAIMMVASRSRARGNGARRHDAGNRAGEARQQRNEGAARESHLAHEPIEHEGGARQVAGVLQRENEEEQDQNLRQEYQHAAGAGDHAIEQQSAQRARRQHAAQPAAEHLHAALMRSCGPLAQLNTAWNMRNSTSRQQHRSRDRVQHHRIQARQQAQACRHAVADFLQHAAHFALRRLDLGGAAHGRRPGARRRCAPAALKSKCSIASTSCALAAGAHRHGLHDRHAERALERRAVELIAALLGDVAHVERDDHRPPEALQFQHQAQVQAQIGRIHHAYEQVGGGLAGVPAEHDVARDGLIQGGGLQAVGARQIDDAEDAPAVGADEAGLPCARP